MIRKISIITIFVTLFAFVNIDNYNAEDVITDGTAICSNVEYSFDITGTNHQVIVLDQNNNLIDSYIYNEGDTVVFPSNVPDIKVLIYNMDEEGNNVFSSEIDFSVSDCGYEIITDDYSYSSMNSSVELVDNTLEFTLNSDLNDYQLEVQDLNKNSGKVLELTDNKATYGLSGDGLTQYVHVIESYTTDDGDEIQNYFEIDMSSEILFIRSVNSFSINIIDKSSLINLRSILFIFILLLAILILNKLIRNTNKKIKNQKIRAQKKKKRRLVKGDDADDNEE